MVGKQRRVKCNRNVVFLRRAKPKPDTDGELTEAVNRRRSAPAAGREASEKLADSADFGFDAEAIPAADRRERNWPTVSKVRESPNYLVSGVSPTIGREGC